MNNVIKFPSIPEREWQFWEKTIRDSYRQSLFDEAVIEDSLPAIKKHWETIFEEISLTPPPIEIPGPLTENQIDAIRRSSDASVSTVIKRLKLERSKSMMLLIQTEMMLAHVRRNGMP